MYWRNGGTQLNPWPCPAEVNTITTNGLANQMNFTPFAIDLIFTRGKFQYATYSDPDGNVFVAKRNLDSTASWSSVDTGLNLDITDEHHSPSMGMDSSGILHVCANFHNDGITGRYARSDLPEDISAWTQFNSWTGANEASVTYASYLYDSGDFYLYYRRGFSGDGEMYVNVWKGESESWSAKWHPLINSTGSSDSPYWNPIDVDSSGNFHLSWCIRDVTGSVSSNKNVCYAFRDNADDNWYKSDHTTQYNLPISSATAEVVLSVSVASGLINQCGHAVDENNFPHITYYMSATGGFLNYVHIYQNTASWTSDRVSFFRSYGKGAIGSSPMHTRPLCITLGNEVVVFFNPHGNGGSKGPLYAVRGTAGDYKWYRIGGDLYSYGCYVDRYRNDVITILVGDDETNGSGGRAIYTLDIQKSHLLKEDHP